MMHREGPPADASKDARNPLRIKFLERRAPQSKHCRNLAPQAQEASHLKRRKPRTSSAGSLAPQAQEASHLKRRKPRTSSAGSLAPKGLLSRPPFSSRSQTVQAEVDITRTGPKSAARGNCWIAREGQDWLSISLSSPVMPLTKSSHFTDKGAHATDKGGSLSVPPAQRWLG
jgi:hypothetical protein